MTGSFWIPKEIQHASNITWISMCLCRSWTLTWPSQHSSLFPHPYIKGVNRSHKGDESGNEWKLVDMRIMKTRKRNEEKQEDGDHVSFLWCISYYLHSTKLIRCSAPRLSDKTETWRLKVKDWAWYWKISFLSPGKMYPVSSVKLHVRRMFEKHTSWSL